MLIVGGGAMTAFAGGAVYWMEPHRRLARQMRRMLDGVADAVISGPVRGQGAALRFDQGRVAIVRGPTDHGLLFDVHELVGAELIFDGHVAARAFRGESRRPLDKIDPEVRRVILRLVFDDGHDTGLYSWDLLHELGADRGRLWSEYLQTLEKAGLKR